MVHTKNILYGGGGGQEELVGSIQYFKIQFVSFCLGTPVNNNVSIAKMLSGLFCFLCSGTNVLLCNGSFGK